MEDKYIELILKRCLNFDKSNILFINYDVVNKDFVDKVKKYASKYNLEVVEDIDDINITHSKLKDLSIDEIKHDSYFNKSKWDVYANKGASFMMIDTEFPGVLDDISPEKIAVSAYTKRETRPIFRKKETNYEIPWVIFALPNQIWADSIYKNETDSYNKLETAIYKMCMVDTPNPIASWEKYLKTVKERTTYLNSLHITKLHYTNKLGTDLIVSYPDNVIWSSIADDIDHNMLVNMPSYEIFTSPSYLKTNGIVYSSKPLIYGGSTIDEFYLEFVNGKVTKFGAKKGYEVLKGIVESDSNACYLGETALVNNDSPISSTRLVFGTTLIDENASCHLALGDGFAMSIKDGEKLTKDELLEKGINQSNNHVDFMIGTSDMSIEALTDKGIIPIFVDGNFVK